MWFCLMRSRVALLPKVPWPAWWVLRHLAIRIIGTRRCEMFGFLAYQIVVWIYTMVVCGDPDEFQ